MHNNIMAAGSRDRPPMLATRNDITIGDHVLYDTFMTRPNGDVLRKCNSTSSRNVGSHREVTTRVNPLNIQDVEDKPYFGSLVNSSPLTMERQLSLTTHEILQDENVMSRNNLTVATMQVNVHFFTTSTRMGQDLSRLKAKYANSIRHLLLIAQTMQDPYEINTKTSQIINCTTIPQELYLPTRISKQQLEARIKRLATLDLRNTFHKLSTSLLKKTVSDPEHAHIRTKIIRKTSSNTRNKNVDTTPRYKNDNQTGQFRNQRAVNVVGARETVGGQVVQQSGIPCFNCKEFGHYAKDAESQNGLKTPRITRKRCCWHLTAEPLEHVHYDTDHIVFTNDLQHFEQSESIRNTCAVETGDSNVIPTHRICGDNDIHIQKQLKKANATLTQELTECKSVLTETSRTLGESNSIRDSCLVALQNKQTELEEYMAFNNRTVDYEKLEHKLNETLGLLAQKDIDIKEGLKLKAYEISVVKEKHDELVKQSLLTKSHYEGLVKEKTKVITDLKLKEEQDIDKMISMEKQLKFLNEIVYKRSQSIQTIHMLAPKCPTFNGRPTFANPMYLKKAQYEKPCLYEIPHDQSDPANRLIPDREEILTLEEESRSKLNKDLVKPYDYTMENSLYEIFKPPTQEYQIQLAHANEIRKKMWRKSFVKTKPNIFKNIDFLPVSKSISKSRQAYNVMTNNISHLKDIVDQAWNDSFAFVHELKKEMHADLKYIESLEDEIDELESDKTEFSNMYDMLLQECVSNDVMCSYFHSLSDLDGHTELQCLYLHKVKECDCLAQKLSKQTESINFGNVMPVCATCGKYVFNSNDDACVSKYLNDVNARTKKPEVVHISTRKPKIQANQNQLQLPNLQALVISVRTDKGTEFLNKTLNAFFKEEGIEHQTSTPRTPEQNGVVERRNRTLVEAAQTMLSDFKVPVFFWAEAIATACYTQNRSILITTHEKMTYHIINDRKPSIKHLHIFGCICYLTRDGENLDKMKEKGDPCILVGYSTQSKGYRLVPQRQKASDYDNSDPDPQLQNVSPSADTTVPSQQELDLLFGPLYDEFFNAGASRVNKSSSPTDNSAQQDTLPSTNIHPTTEPSTPTHVNAEEQPLIKQNYQSFVHHWLQVVVLFALAWMDFHELELTGDLSSIALTCVGVDGSDVGCGVLGVSEVVSLISTPFVVAGMRPECISNKRLRHIFDLIKFEMYGFN
ncbi:integrase, catalytic region, zinc finger, CCHC-type containing protein [Tanacetum coccineum]|uniref:Integrase, catalytic region, zinc finger, CCHC-type containing protein n=1 Tax=Tanacetum coccineum TaxID=301880 RepID=A0ABQ4WT54_9ASTR